MSSPTDTDWAAKAAALKKQLLKTRNMGVAIPQPDKMPSSSNPSSGKGKRPGTQGERVAANASTIASKMKASLSASSAETGSDESTTIAQGGAGKESQNSPAITDTLMAKLATTSVSSSQGSSTSISTQPSKAFSMGTRGVEMNTLDAKSKMFGPSSTLRPGDSSSSAQNKPESKLQNANNNKNGKRAERDAQSSTEEGEIREDIMLPKFLTKTTTATAPAESQKKSGASSRPTVAPATAATIARQKTPSVPQTSGSSDDKISDYVPREPRSERKPLQRLLTTTYPARLGSNATVSSPTQHDEARGGPSSGSLPPRPGRPDLSKTMSRQVVELARKQPHGGPQLRRPQDRARSASPRNEQPSTATTLTLRTRSIPRTNSEAAAAADDDWKEQRQLEEITSHQDRDLRDWLRFTGWNDIEYRRGELARQRRLAEIGREKAELELEAEAAKQARQQHKDVASTTTSLHQSLLPTPRLPDAERTVGFSRRTEIRRVEPASFGRLMRFAAGVKRERRGSDDERGGAANKYYRGGQYRGRPRGCSRRGLGYSRGDYSRRSEPYHNFDEREDYHQRRDNRPTPPFRLGTPPPQRPLGWSRYSTPLEHEYLKWDDLIDVHHYREREPTKYRGCGRGYRGGDYAGPRYRGGLIRRR
ncbi:hypothetical protein VPNG_09000 [Cytospora leucostoma]|uniref:Uncharacterized protein n=1 Tax=Cytospora leucostoma TaxID=1230097 RepID=A0A423VZZ5_9PEZI|nr:hypothetical protein VPNG_09000 [Cytospora leucostoma]